MGFPINAMDETPPSVTGCFYGVNGAAGENRTLDLSLTKGVLYL